MKLIDLLGSTPNTGQGAWPKTFRNMSVPENSFNSFIRYNADLTFESSMNGEIWRQTRGYWMFLPQFNWEVFKPKQTWSLSAAIREIYGYNAILAISNDISPSHADNFIIAYIRQYGDGMTDAVSLHVVHELRYNVETFWEGVVRNIRAILVDRTGKEYCDMPIDSDSYRKALGL